jgi:hypothetical protein
VNVHLKAADGTPMANAMLSVLHTLGVDVKSFGDSTGTFDLNSPAAFHGGGGVADMRAVTSLRRMAVAVALAAAISVGLLAAPESPVASAAQAGDLVRVKALLKEGGDVNAALGDGTTALHHAAMRGDAEMVRRAALCRRQRARHHPARRLHRAASGQPARARRRHRRPRHQGGRRRQPGHAATGATPLMLAAVGPCARR